MFMCVCVFVCVRAINSTAGHLFTLLLCEMSWFLVPNLSWTNKRRIKKKKNHDINENKFSEQHRASHCFSWRWKNEKKKMPKRMISVVVVCSFLVTSFFFFLPVCVCVFRKCCVHELKWNRIIESVPEWDGFILVFVYSWSTSRSRTMNRKRKTMREMCELGNCQCTRVRVCFDSTVDIVRRLCRVNIHF